MVFDTKRVNKNKDQYQLEMVTLVICIDRDDDLGRKTGRISPIIGRSANLEAAVALGLADPGESDTNTMFEAIRTYDKLKAEGHKVEVTTLCGDIRVGDRSDMKIARQLDQVIKDTRAEHAVLITDGSEDAYLTPIIASRLKINATRRVYIKQAPNIESTYYTIRAMLDDPKIQTTLFYPVLLMGLIGLIQLYNGSYAWGLVLLVMTSMFLIRYYKLEEALVEFTGDAFTGVRSRVTLVTGFFALFLLIAGLISGFDKATEDNEDGTAKDAIESVLIFFSTEGVLLWVIGSVWVLQLGRVVDHYFNEGEFKISFFRFTLMLGAVYFVTSGAVDLMYYVLVEETKELVDIFFNFIIGIMCAMFGWGMVNYLRNQENEGNGRSPLSDWQD